MIARRSGRASVLPVTDERGQRWRLAGMMAHEDDPAPPPEQRPDAVQPVVVSEPLVGDIMTAPAAYCTPSTDLERVAALMIYNHCGALPVVENEATMMVVGIITDRDIVCRTVGQGLNALERVAGECMTERVATIRPEETLTDCCDVMRETGVRRLPVVDGDGCLRGMITLADIARHASPERAGALMRDIARTPYPYAGRATGLADQATDEGLPSL